MLKKILTPLLSVGLFVALGVSSNSCAPTEPSDTSAVTLVSAPSILALTKTDSAGSSSIGLTCGCPFPLTVTGYGDTSVIHFSFAEKLDASITTHNVIATIIPSSLTGPHTDTAWIGLYTPHDSTSTNPGTPLYDTLRVTATY